MQFRSFTEEVPAVWLVNYRRVFGIIILLELLFLSDTIIHVYYERWEPCYVPIFREMNIPVTHDIVDFALFVGMLSAILFVCDRALPFARVLNRVVDVTLLVSYTYLRIIHFYMWNNHYYLNMLLLFVFTLIPGGDDKRPTRPHWEYLVIQIFFGTVYFFAGVSKISTAWLGGLITETMTHNHGFLLPNIMISWGGFLLDLLGGLAVMINVFHPLGKQLNIFVHFSFFLFHFHNLVFMFKSIQFFPLHMCFSPLAFVPSIGGGHSSVGKSSSRFGLKFYILWLIVVAQALFATRRFFILVDRPWEILKANDIAEFHSQVHHFSWRMKSRTCSSQVLIQGKWPLMMTVSLGGTDQQPEEVSNLVYTKVFFNKIYADAEFAVQPLVNRVRKTLPDADPEKMFVRLAWWVEVNHGPFQLLINPELNFVKADHLPMIGAPPTTHVEPLIVPPSNWQERLALESADAEAINLSLAPFVSRKIDSVWIPNPLIGYDDPRFMPKAIVCMDGLVVVRVNGTEYGCSGTSLPLPRDGKFFLQFKSDLTYFLLAFKK